ncbi:MAG: tRNA (N6-threonylcarbamoyladenosine(37)-N6)-methyltransferase TrmO [Methanomassiliicoccales archaeon]
MEYMRLLPVGVVENEFKEPSLMLRDGELNREGQVDHSHRDMVSRIVIDERFQEALEGVEDFSHLLVIYWTGCRTSETLKVHPAGQKDLAPKGIFSTRSPARPNPLAVTTVELLGREGNVLTVKGLDAIDGSIVVDIKIHLPGFDAPEGVKLADWMVDLQGRFGD